MGNRDPRIDAYIGNAAPFGRPILEHLREAVHEACPECEETLKWSAPSFTYRGKILCGMASFTQHASFNLWHAEKMQGLSKRDEAMGQFGRLAKISDLPPKNELRGYIREAMKLIDEGATRTSTRSAGSKTPLPVPDDLAKTLSGNAKARETFEGFPPSAKREYIEWITRAKREETRRKRLDQTVEWLAEGKRRNWKYETC